MTKNYAQQENLDQIEHNKWLESQDSASLEQLADGVASLMAKAKAKDKTFSKAQLEEAQAEEAGAIEAEKVRRLRARQMYLVGTGRMKRSSN